FPAGEIQAKIARENALQVPHAVSLIPDGRLKTCPTCGQAEELHLAVPGVVVAEEEEGEVFGGDAAVGIGVEIPEVAGLVGPFAEGAVEDFFVASVHVAIAVGVAEEAEERVDAVAALGAVAVAVEQPAGSAANVIGVDDQPVLAVGKRSAPERMAFKRQSSQRMALLLGNRHIELPRVS